jgi:hypothetical protein
MTDEQITEIYSLAREASFGGQRSRMIGMNRRSSAAFGMSLDKDFLRTHHDADDDF